MRQKVLGIPFFMMLLLGVMPWVLNPAEAKDGFTQKDRELLIRMEERLNQMDKRFEQIDKRFEDLHSEMDKRFAELRSDMNKRFEQVDRRFEQMMTFLWILASVFSALVVAVIGFALWDRKTMIRRARDEIEKEGRLSDLIQALRELARKDKELAEVLRHFNLL